MAELQLDALVFDWLVTSTNEMRIIPAKPGIGLLQTYFDEHGCPPEWAHKIDGCRFN